MRLLYKLAIAFVFVGSFIGCSKDFLDTKPTDTIGEKDAEGTLQGLNAILQGIHNMMYSYQFPQGFGYGQGSMNAQLDMLGDDMINTLSAYYMDVYRYTSTMNVVNDDGINYKAWDFYYTVIQHANKVIHGVEKLSNVSHNDRNTLLGEGHAFRAWAYHNLVQLFAKRYKKGDDNSQLGVIIRPVDKPEDHLPRATVAEVYALIDSDMAKSLDYLENANDKKIKNAIRYSTACGIAARIALTKSDWENAEKYAHLAITKSGASLQSGGDLLDGFRNYEATEWMWGYRQAPDQNYYYSHFFAHYSYNMSSRWLNGLRFAVNRDIYDLMGEKDARRGWWVCSDRGDKIPEDAYTGYFRGGTTNPQWEITGQSIKFKAKSATDSSGDMVLMRLAEMYYIKAEAQARQNKDAEAQTTLNTIMKTRDADYNKTFTGTQLIDEIMRNKRIDLWMEGQRFFDMKRLGIIPNRLNSRNIQVYLTGTKKQTAISRNSGNNAVNLPNSLDSKFWQFAIPYAEIKGNPLVEQNEL